VNARVPIYEGDGLLHDALERAARPATVRIERRARIERERTAPAVETVAAAPTREEIWEIERRARALRAEAIADLFSRLFRAVANVFRAAERSLYRAHQRDIEHYLAQATDNADLERRLRELERSPNLDPYWSRR